MPDPTIEAPSLTTVCREVALAGGQDDRLAAAVERLGRMNGVLRVVPHCAARLRLSYDAARIAYGEIERALDEAGLRRRASAWWRLRGAWYRFLDENIKANARARGGACCSRPPAGSGGPDSEP